MWKKKALFLLFLLWLLAFFSQAVQAGEAFYLTMEEADELTSLLESLERENKELIKNSDGLKSLNERLKTALTDRTNSFNDLRKLYEEYESETKRTLSEQNARLIELDIANKRKTAAIITLSIILFLVISLLIAENALLIYKKATFR